MLEEDKSISEQATAISGPVYARSLAIRSAAMSALEKLDASDKWRRAILADKRPPTEEWAPGTCVFFWRTARTRTNLKRRGARLVDRWLGPAVVIGRERGIDGATCEGY